MSIAKSKLPKIILRLPRDCRSSRKRFLIFQFEHRHAEIALAVSAGTEGAYARFIAAEIVPKRAAQCTCPLTVYDRNVFITGGDTFIQPTVDHEPGIIAGIAADINLVFNGGAAVRICRCPSAFALVRRDAMQAVYF